MITCKICGKEVKQITSSHLKSHQMTISLYKEQFPGSPIIDPETSAIISSKASGRERTQEHKDALRATISAQYANGRKANRGKLGKSDSEETLEKKRLARTGKTHTQQTKDKIGLAHRGKTVSRESVEKCQATKKARIEEFGPYKPGVMSPEVMEARNAKLSEIARKRTPDQVAEKVRLMNEARRGQIISEEERENHRRARLKYMSENPQRKFSDTAGEIQLKYWLSDNNLDYEHQFLIQEDSWQLYDFYVPSLNLLIEFDGAHHWDAVWFGVVGKTQAEKDKLLEKQKSKDAMCSEYAKRRGYNIVRIQGCRCVNDTDKVPDFNTQMLNQGYDISNMKPLRIPYKIGNTLYFDKE